MKILLLSRYGSLGASSRVRYLQYLPYLEHKGLSFKVEPLLSNKYLKSLYAGRHDWREVLKGYLSRIWTLFRVKRFDLVIIEKELFPFFPAFAERVLRLTGVSYLADYDDALFHKYDLHSNVLVRHTLGKKIDTVMRHAAVVVAGNAYLADRARTAGAPVVETIPTVVDCKYYKPCSSPHGKSQVIVGWIGTPKTSKYLEPLIPVFEVLQKKKSVRFVAIGANAKDFAGTPVETWPWSKNSEVKAIQKFDIGIMPLPDSPWERGKCGYKLIQYMACGIPVVASPMGVNKDIVKPGKNGYLSNTIQDWEEHLSTLICMNDNDRGVMGKTARKQVKNWYSVQVQASRLLNSIQKAAE
jgi:glycosyltransferase involved in cell wall biosynthesis